MRAAQQPDSSQQLLNEIAAADWLAVRPQTLSSWRKAGKGPRYVKLGKGRTAAIRYRRDDLDAWLESCARTSTSDTGKAA